MSVEKDGGPAFPVHGIGMFSEPITLKDGMTLRDWFAGQALAGMMANRRADEITSSQMARHAWKSAGEMLAARKDEK